MMALAMIFKKGFLLPIFLLALFSIVGCDIIEDKPEKKAMPQSEKSSLTPYAQNKEKDALDDRPFYDRYVEGVGQEKTDLLYQELGQETMDLLSYGAGTSNIISLVNVISSTDKLISMVGNDYATPPTGLGAIRIIGLLNSIDKMMLVPTYRGTPPGDHDTIQRLADLINKMSLDTVVNKVVELVNKMGVSRNMGNSSDQEKVDKMSKLIAHVGDINKVVVILNDMNASTITTKMKDLLLGVTDVGKMVGTVDHIATTSKMISLIENVTDVNKLTAVLNAVEAVHGGPKLGYVVENVTSVAALTTLMNLIVNASKMAELINKIEDGSSWTGQIGNPQIWIGIPNHADSGMIRLVKIVNELSANPNPSKLIKILDNVTDMTKMMRFVQDIANVADIVTLIKSLADPATNAVPTENLAYILNNVSLASIPRMVIMVNGQRVAGNGGDQAIYLAKLSQLVTELNNSKEGPLKVGKMVDGISNADKIIDLVYGVTNVSNLSTVINDTDKPSSDWPNNNAITTLVYIVEQLSGVTKLITLINGAPAAKVTVLINGIAAGSQWADTTTSHVQATVDDTEAAGKKLKTMVDLIVNTDSLVTMVNNVTDTNKLIVLVNSTTIVNVNKIVAIVNDITVISKLVTLVNNVTSMPDLAAMVAGITDSKKLSTFVNLSTNAANVASLVNAVLVNVDTKTDDLINMMNLLLLADIPKVSTLVNVLNGTQDALVAGLLGAYSPDGKKGIGHVDLVKLIQGLSGDASASRLGTMMSTINTNLNYLGGSITTQSGLVRLLTPYGMTYNTVTFPGLGPDHVANMMNNLNSATKLTTLLNTLGIEQMAPLVGCVDRVGWDPSPAPGQQRAGAPDFKTPCTAIKMGW